MQVVSLHLLSRLLPGNPAACFQLLAAIPGGPAATAEASPPLPPPPLARLLCLLRDWVARTRFLAACCLTHLATAPAASTDGSSRPAWPQMGRAKAAALSVLLRLLSEPGILELVPPVLARLLENR